MQFNLKKTNKIIVGKYFGKGSGKKEIEDYFNSFASKEGTRFRWRDIANNSYNNLHNRIPIEVPSVHDVKGEVL
ncbi:MAG: hypothetical protein HYV28_06935 [Ignavibacteriales bacterium]|nr:hypothetical protein [Ignavibacteriales bacterium]